jgi:hypothetical protein
MYTVSNLTRRGRSLPLLFFLFSLSTLVELKAQKISKYYTVSSQKNGSLYFIEPEYGFENKKENCELIFDMTFLSTQDTLLLNFSLVSPEITEIDSISFTSSQKNISSQSEKLFIEDEKKSWKHRYSSQFLFVEVYEVFQSEESPILTIYSEGQKIPLTMKQNKWKKERDIVSKIFKMIQVN